MFKKILLSFLATTIIISSIPNHSNASEKATETYSVQHELVEDLQEKYDNVGEFLTDNFTKEEINIIKDEYEDEFGEDLDLKQPITPRSVAFFVQVLANALGAIVATAAVFSLSSATTWLKNRLQKDGAETKTCGQVKISGRNFNPSSRANWIGSGYANSSDKVKALQEYINRAKIGHTLTTDGKYGPKTDKAIRALQGKLNLTKDGIVGTSTWMKMGGKDNSVCI
ncbi:peptidoglycan-binding protein [Peribacillus muralis]|uniref:peptidoglycan-binding domain-containing protein n=1 Tax=Peribacillus muralis TaxID=264697 RepID=UPI001F4EE19C|nr:peptidoglycan-binding domain-containing protein [Peribacillus muralis]MCK1992242.1 peptidoglycan-binding protein [Peribacillus muralis]MCK2012798.1 peptidoglycan-binding protein [Peribacillus muralis]